MAPDFGGGGIGGGEKKGRPPGPPKRGSSPVGEGTLYAEKGGIKL